MVCEGRDYYSLEANILFGRTDVLTAHCSLLTVHCSSHALHRYTATPLHRYIRPIQTCDEENTENETIE